MKWLKKELVYGAKGEFGSWMDNSAMKPIPVMIGDVLRVYVTFRTKDGAGRPGYVDVNSDVHRRYMMSANSPCWN